MSDASIMGTADDAASTKYAAVQAGYYQDPFLAAFSVRQRHCQPIIKRGTYARVMCMDRAISAFIQSREDPRIVVLGAGNDTTFFRYISGLLIEPKPVQWYEVDHTSMIHKKAKIIQQQQRTFQAQVKTHSCGGFVVTSDKATKSICHLVDHDLRKSPSELIDKLAQHGLHGKTHAILFVVECMQLYLEECSSRTLWKTLALQCPQACLLLFDPIVGVSSSFGSVMEQNLLRVKVITPDSSMVQTRTLSQQMEKFVDLCGWQQAIGCDMWWAYNTMLTPEQRQHAQNCEFLDEVEEWKLIMQHYCFVVACATNAGLDICRAGPLLGLEASRCEIKTRKL